MFYKVLYRISIDISDIVLNLKQIYKTYIFKTCLKTFLILFYTYLLLVTYRMFANQKQICFDLKRLRKCLRQEIYGV